MGNEWSIRLAREADIPFLYSTWLRSYRESSHIGGACRTSIFYRAYTRVIDHILDRPDTSVRVAVAPGDADVIYGYAVFQPAVLHYVFTKEAFRKLGIARSLLDPVIDTLAVYTHRTRNVADYLAQQDGFDYDPFQLFNKSTIKGDSDVQSIGENSAALRGP